MWRKNTFCSVFPPKAREFTRYSQLLGISLLYCTNYQYILFCLCRHHVNSLHYSNFLCFCRETEGHLLECLQAQSIFLFILFITKCLLIWTRRFWYSEMGESVLAFKRPQKPQLHLITNCIQGVKYVPANSRFEIWTLAGQARISYHAVVIIIIIL